MYLFSPCTFNQLLISSRIRCTFSNLVRHCNWELLHSRTKFIISLSKLKNIKAKPCNGGCQWYLLKAVSEKLRCNWFFCMALFLPQINHWNGKSNKILEKFWSTKTQSCVFSDMQLKLSWIIDAKNVTSQKKVICFPRIFRTTVLNWVYVCFLLQPSYISLSLQFWYKYEVTGVHYLTTKQWALMVKIQKNSSKNFQSDPKNVTFS